MSDVGGEAMFCCVSRAHEVVACSLFLCSFFVILALSYLEYGCIDVVVLQNHGEDLTLRKCEPLNSGLEEAERGKEGPTVLVVVYGFWP